MKIVFLHIPKTAGQSIHASLQTAFGVESVCPARVNDQLKLMSVNELNSYRVFSGHFDWSLLDCIKGPKYVFTVLREPLDRVLSFYFYLRGEAERLSLAELCRPDRQGLKAALELSPYEYFVSAAPMLRRFIDDHYDNFYTYYFAGRTYHSRGELRGLMGRLGVQDDHVLRVAKDNLSTLDAVFTVQNLSKVFDVINKISGGSGASPEYHVNVNISVTPEDRIDKLKQLGGDLRVFDKIQGFCRLDNELWRMYSE